MAAFVLDWCFELVVDMYIKPAGRLAFMVLRGFELWISANEPNIQSDKSTSCNNFHMWRYARRWSGNHLQPAQFWNKVFLFYNNNNNNFLKYLIVPLKWVLKMSKLRIWSHCVNLIYKKTHRNFTLYFNLVSNFSIISIRFRILLDLLLWCVN